jgi:hypothetical protein
MLGYKLLACSNMMHLKECSTPYLMLEILPPRPGAMLSNQGVGMLRSVPFVCSLAIKLNTIKMVITTALA